MKRKAEVGQPLAQLRGSARVVIVEVGASGEDLDGLETVAGDMREVLAG